MNERQRKTALDLISRRAAIDAICKACSMVEDYHKCDGYPETSTWCEELVALRALPSAQPESYQEKLKEIADALSEKFAYMHTCLNERDIILGYLGVKHSNEIHCNTDCTNTKCESNHFNKRLPSAQPTSCDTCQYNGRQWDEEPCDSCTMGGETNHYNSSAQPEIIRCKDAQVIHCKECRHYEIFPNGANGNCKLNVDAEIRFYPWDYCSHAERREDETDKP